MPLTRYASNPVFESAGVDAWDYSKSIVTVLKFGDGDYRMWYSAGENNPEVRRRPAYATSTDGITWTKPNLGLVSFGGNSNNNLLLGNLNRFTSLTYDAANSRYLMMLAYTQAAADYGIHIWSSADGISFTSLKTVITATAFGTNCEGRDLVQRADGRWIAYYSTGHAADLRNVGAYLSDTSDITGTWTHIGIVLANAGSTSQRYGITVQVFDDWYLGYVLRYNSTTEQLVVDLYRSQDALNWSLVESDWLPLGTSGAWDDEAVYLGKALLQEGSDYRFYYAGWPENHATDSARQVGFATATESAVQEYLGTSMSIVIATARGAVNTSTGNQDFTTTDLGGLTPKAAYFRITRAVTDGVAANHAVLGVGVATSTSARWAVCGSDENATGGNTDSYGSESSLFCTRIILPTTGAVDGEADFVSFIADGVRINWTDAPSAAYLLTVILFAGTGLSAIAGSTVLGDTVNEAIDVTTVGFQPDVLFTALMATQAMTSLGIVHESGGTVTQRALAHICRDNASTSAISSYLRSDAGILEVATLGTLDWYGEFSSFDSSGFTITARNAGANNEVVRWLALDFGGEAAAWVGTHTTPTSTGNNAVTAPGFTPQFVFMLPSLVEAVNTSYTDSLSGTIGVISVDADEAYCDTVSSEDGTTTPNTQSLSDDVVAAIPDHVGTLDIEATFVSFDPTGWTFNYSNITATGKLWPALAIQAVAAGGGVPKHMMHYKGMRSA